MVKKVFFFVAFLFTYNCWGQNNTQPLFQSEGLLELTIRLDVGALISDRVEREEHEAELRANDSGSKTLDVKLSVRGNTRAKTDLCDFPPISLNLKKKQVEGTLFAGQNKLKLVTHCKARAINQQYVLREYYVYKLYQLISPFSFQVRLCKISYIDTDQKYDLEPQFGFLIEDIDDLAERNNMAEFDGKIGNQDACYREFLDRLTVFEFLIGNLDWSIPNRHNFKLIYGDDYPIPVAVPYDFDFSGMVGTNYAQPPQDIDISTVKTRVFRGLCRPEGSYEKTIQYYLDIKPQIYELYKSSPYLDEKSINSAIKYLDSFYKIAENPKQVHSKINKACRASHKHLY